MSELVLKQAGFIVRRCFAVETVSKKWDFSRARGNATNLCDGPERVKFC